MKESSTIVIQFNTIDDIITEMALTDVTVARVWPAAWGTGGEPGLHHEAIVIQAIDAAQGAVLMASLLLGTYQVIYGKPFGPTAEACAKIIKERREEAMEKVKAHLVAQLPDLAIRNGNIHTNIQGPSISRASWSGFDDIYEAQNAIRRAER